MPTTLPTERTGQLQREHLALPGGDPGACTWQAQLLGPISFRPRWALTPQVRM